MDTTTTNKLLFCPRIESVDVVLLLSSLSSSMFLFRLYCLSSVVGLSRMNHENLLLLLFCYFCVPNAAPLARADMGRCYQYPGGGLACCCW